MRSLTLLSKQSIECLTYQLRTLDTLSHLPSTMAPKIRYDAAEMQAKANEVAEKEIRILAREGVELPRSAEVT